MEQDSITAASAIFIDNPETWPRLNSVGSARKERSALKLMTLFRHFSDNWRRMVAPVAILSFADIGKAFSPPPHQGWH